MLFVINDCFGRYSLSEAAREKLGVEDDWLVERNNETLVKLVQEDAKKASGSCARLVLVSVPDDFTDYMIQDYDGSENLYYVQDGKIKVAQVVN